MAQFAALSGHWPFLLTVTPLFGAAMAAIQARRGVAAARQSAMVNSTLTLLAALALAAQFFSAETGPPRMTSQLFQWDFDAGARIARVHVAFGVDGISLGPLLLIAVIGWVVIWTLDRANRDESATSYVGILIGQAIGFATFAAQDALLFLAASELYIWWLFVMTGRQGGPDRRVAARQVLLVGWTAHALWGLAIIGLAACQSWIETALNGSASDFSFRFADIIARQSRRILGNETALRVWIPFQAWIVPLWLGGLILRWPLVPFHGWWTNWILQARRPVAVMGSAILILETGYAWFRFVVPFGFSPSNGWALVLSLSAGAGLVWCGISAVGQTDPRRLIGVLTVGSLQLALVGCISGSVTGELAAAQMLGSLALAQTSALLCHGRNRLLRTISLCGLGLFPTGTFLTGGGLIWLMQSRGIGFTSWATFAGCVLLSWAAIRGALNEVIENGSADESFSRRDWLAALPIVLVFIAGLLPNWWQPAMRPAWESLHNPFSAGGTIESVRPAKSLAESDAAATAARPIWPSAPAIWTVIGIALLLWPRTEQTSAGTSALAVVGLLVGAIVEFWPFDAIPLHENWATAVWWSVLLIGLTFLTIRCEDMRPSAETSGAWLLRLAAAAFAARSADLILAGLAWELVELMRGLLESGSKENIRRDRWRFVVSSMCFWTAVAMFHSLARSTQLDVIAAWLAETIPRNAEGGAIGPASAFGLVATILLVAAIGSRCGLLPWSFGRDVAGGSLPRVLTVWLDRLIGLTFLISVVRVSGGAYSDPLCIMLCISAAATAGWSAAASAQEHRAAMVLNGLLTWQFALLILGTAASAASAAISVNESPGLTVLPIEPFLGRWSLAISAALSGIVAGVCWIGLPAHGELYLEHHQGLMMKRPLPAIILIMLLLGTITTCPLWGFWPRAMSFLSLTLTPQRQLHDDFRLHPLLMAVAVIVLSAGTAHLAKAADWLRAMVFDPPVSGFPKSSGWWPECVACLAALMTLLGSWLFEYKP